MRLLSQAPTRYVLLVLDDRAESVSARLRRAADGAELVAFTSREAAASAVVSGRRYSAVVADRIDQHLAEVAARAGIPAIAAGPTTTPEQLAAAIRTSPIPCPKPTACSNWAPPRAGSWPGTIPAPTAGWSLSAAPVAPGRRRSRPPSQPPSPPA